MAPTSSQPTAKPESELPLAERLLLRQKQGTLDTYIQSYQNAKAEHEKENLMTSNKKPLKDDSDLDFELELEKKVKTGS